MLRQRGIISPPRSRYSQTRTTSSISPPLRRPTTAVVDPDEQRRTHRDQESRPTAVKRKPNATSATKSNNDNTSSTSKIVSSSRTSQLAAEKNINSTPKTATKTKQTSQPLRRSTLSTGARASAGGGAKDSASKKKTDSPNARNRLQKLSMDGNDVANIDDLDANSIHEYVAGSDKKERHSLGSNARRRFHNIYKEIASHRQENSSNITSYFAKLKALWNEPAARSYSERLSEATEGEIKVMQFLLGLNDSHSTICAQILVMSPFPTVEKAYSLVIQEQNRRELVLSPQIVMQNNDGVIEEADNEVTSFPIQPFMTNLPSPVRC